MTRQKEMWIIIGLIIIAIIVAIAGCDEEGFNTENLPTYVWPDVEEMVYALCKEKGIDVNEPFVLCCPKCGYAKFENKKKESHVYSIFGFLARPKEKASDFFDEGKGKIIESTLHCSGCEYLFGNDWTVYPVEVTWDIEIGECIDIEVDSNDAGFKIIGVGENPIQFQEQ